MRRLGLLALIGFALPVVLWLVMVRPFRDLLPSSAPLRSVVHRPDMQKIIDFRFNDLSGRLKGWEEKIFQGKTFYEVRLDVDGEGMLAATSRNSSSALFSRVDVPIEIRPFLVWRWKAPVFPAGKKTANIASKEDNDFAGRVYVIFESRSMFSADVIEYVWDDRFAEGTYAVSPYSEHIRILVVQHGPQPEDGGWVAERRDVVQDYTMLFGKAPRRDIAAIAIMADSDSTKSRSGILVKHISLETAERATKGGEAT